MTTKKNKPPVPPKRIPRSKGYGPLHQHLRPGCIVVLDPAGTHAELTLADHHKYRTWTKGQTFLFLFEIENMPGHGAFADYDGKVWWGMHLDAFRMATKEEV